MAGVAHHRLHLVGRLELALAVDREVGGRLAAQQPVGHHRRRRLFVQRACTDRPGSAFTSSVTTSSARVALPVSTISQRSVGDSQTPMLARLVKASAAAAPAAPALSSFGLFAARAAAGGLLELVGDPAGAALDHRAGHHLLLDHQPQQPLAGDRLQQRRPAGRAAPR